MTIEKSPAPASTAKTAGTQQAHGAKAKSAGTDTDAQGAAGFMAILGALGDTATEDTTPLALVADPSTTDAAALAAPFDATLLLQQNPQIAAAQALQKAAANGVSEKDATAALAAPSLLTGPSVVQTPALPVDTKPLQTELPAQELQTALRATRAAATPTGTGAGAVAVQPGTGEAPDSLTQSLQHRGAHAKAGRGLAQSAQDANASGNTAGGVAAERNEAKDAKFLAALDPSKTAQPVRNVEAILVPLVAKQEKSQSERFALAAKQSEPTYAGTALGVSGPDFSQSAALAPTMAPDMQVAEQVTYWVTQNVQNAEMTLDGLGHSPVEVSISVQGNEAQIAFRSDEALTRGVLESAGAHLKDMLQREGMVLTGVSVGTSGSGDAGGSGERRARQPVRQVAIAPLKSSDANVGSGPRLQSGRSVDLFV